MQGIWCDVKLCLTASCCAEGVGLVMAATSSLGCLEEPLAVYEGETSTFFSLPSV